MREMAFGLNAQLIEEISNWYLDYEKQSELGSNDFTLPL